MENDNRFYCKNILLSVAVGAIILVILIFSASCIFLNMSIPLDLSEWPVVFFCGMSGIGAGYTAGRRIKEKGWMFGLVCGIAMWLLIFLSGLLVSSPSFSGMTFIKLIFIIAGSMLGGMLGVNKKGKKLKF